MACSSRSSGKALLSASSVLSGLGLLLSATRTANAWDRRRKKKSLMAARKEGNETDDCETVTRLRCEGAER
jgi:hypothetical protein